MADHADVPIRNAATVIVVRDRADGEGTAGAADGDGLEVLLLRRSAELVFHGGSWVFPGGRMDPGDYPEDGPEDHETAARAAAVREAMEEAAVLLTPDALLPWAHWTTPIGRPRRFATWFYLAVLGVGAEEVAVDGGEISDHLWLTPTEALAAKERGEVDVPAPTFVSLLRLSQYRSVAHAVETVPTERYHRFTPRVVSAGDAGMVSIYGGDVLAGTTDDDLELPGPRHRLWMLAPGWRYEQTLG